MRRKITIRVVNGLQPGETIWDEVVKGFGARRQKEAVSYILKTRFRGRQKLITIGRHGSPWTPDTARKEAQRLLVLLEQGIDPVEKKRQERAKESVEALWKQFDEEHVEKLKERTRQEYRRLFRQYVLPSMGKKPLADVSRDDVVSLHRKLKDKPRTANFCLSVLSKFMNWAETKGYRQQYSNPVRGIRKYPENRRERFLSQEELKALSQALDEKLRERNDIYVVAAIRLLILTGARLNEILTLKWEHVDLERGLLLLPDSKTGRKVIVLNEAACKVLLELPRQKGNPYVICGHKKGQHLVNLQKPWRRIRKRAGLEDVRIHDLRHTFASLAARKGGSLPKVGALLDHSQIQTTQRYAHLIADDIRQLADAVGDQIGTILFNADETARKEMEDAG